MKSFHDTITLYQEHIDGVFDASHTYHYPSHNVTPTIVTNRIIYINTAIERFDLLKNSIFLCDIDDPYEIITDGPEFMDRKNKRKQLIHKDKIRFLKTFPADLIKIIKDENTLLYIDHAIEGWRNVRLQDVASIFDIPVERLRWLDHLPHLLDSRETNTYHLINYIYLEASPSWFCTVFFFSYMMYTVYVFSFHSCNALSVF